MKTERAVKEFLTVDEAAALLDLSPRALREAAARGELPARKIAHRWRFSRLALHQWLSTPETTYLKHAGVLAQNPLWQEVEAAILAERKAQRGSVRKEQSTTN